MSVRRVMGTEVEYGISVQGQPLANPMVASSQVVNAYASATVKARRARWDFEEESPLRDARGFDMSRQVADPSQLTDEDLGLANVILTNGARLYVDHAHPEYSTPEVTTPLDVVRWDKAGEQVMLDASRRAGQLPGGAPINLYKNNTDNKGASYGAHENYLMRRSTPFGEIVRHLTPFFVVAAGRLRVRPGGARPGRPRARLPDQPAGRLLRGRGRSRDDAEAADHQHPRRAARRPRALPAAARDPRRRQPRRGVDLPQGRHHRAGALDDRGPVPRPRPHRRRRRVGTAGGVPRHDAAAERAADRRPRAHRRPAPAGVPRPRPQVRRGPLRRRRRRADRRRPRPVGVGADRLERDPMECAGSSTGSRS